MSRAVVSVVAVAASLALCGCCKQTEKAPSGGSVAVTPDPGATPSPGVTKTLAPGNTGVVPVDDLSGMGPDGLPVMIPTTRSKVPTLQEWNAVPREITVNRSTPLNCETRMVREWLRVSCRVKNNTGGTPTNAEVVAGCTAEAYVYARRDQKIASLVTPLIRGQHCEVRFSWTDKTQTLVTDWVGGGPRPSVKFTGPWP